MNGIGRIQVDAVESINNIYLGQIYGTISRIGSLYTLEDVVESFPKLHSYLGGQVGSVGIDMIVAIIQDGPRPTFALRHNSQGTQL